MGGKGNVAHQDDIVIAADLGEGRFQNRCRALIVAGEKFGIGVDHAARGVEQPFAIGVVAGPCDERAHRRFGFLPAGAVDDPLERGLGEGFGLDVHFHRKVPCCRRHFIRKTPKGCIWTNWFAGPRTAPYIVLACHSTRKQIGKID